MAEETREFSDDLLVPMPGKLVYIPSTTSPSAGSWAIGIPLAPFSASDEYETDWRPGTEGPEVIRTSIELESIALPAETLEELAGRTFQFPTNPTPGYIDGSVYLGAAHNPVDVTEISFGVAQGAAQTVSARLRITIVFEHDLWGVRNRAATLETTLSFERRT